MGDAEWAAFDGLCAHIDAVGNDHWDCSAERLDWIAAESQRILGGGGPSIPGPGQEEDEDDMKYRCFVDDTNTMYAVDGLHAYAIGNPAIYGTLHQAGMMYSEEEMIAHKWPYKYPRQYMMDVFIVHGTSENQAVNPDTRF
jgi:hypothetical protein